jgi:hypothetical protein
MYRRAAILLSAFLAVFSPVTAGAQSTPAPTVTAESESWYLSGEPLLHDGNVYYPRGAVVHFNRNEFVRTGFYRGIPIYSRTTLEPFSVIFVPLAGALMQPYERLRVGEVVGTVGSLGASLPVPIATDERRERRGINGTTTTGQAAGPPTGMANPVDVEGNPRTGAVPVATTEAVAAPAPVGTSGRVVVLPRPRPVVSIARPTGVNAVFVEFDNARWFSAGPTVAFDATAFTRIGERRGLPVYARAGEAGVIYIPVGTDVRGTLARYARR